MGANRDELIAELYAHLEATEELPIRREASRWLGEAQAVARDLVEHDLSDDVIETRVTQVDELLAHVEETENDTADEHVTAALEATEALLDWLESRR